MNRAQIISESKSLIPPVKLSDSGLSDAFNRAFENILNDDNYSADWGLKYDGMTELEEMQIARILYGFYREAHKG